MGHTRGTWAFLFFCLSLAFISPSLLRAQRGAVTLPRNLAELVGQAETIVRGHVVSAYVEPYAQANNAPTVVVTLQVEEVLKGTSASTLTFRQYIWDIRDRKDAAGYRKGQHLILMLNPPTPLGLQSPAGLEQGRFLVLRDTQEQDIAVNGFGNGGLFRDLPTELKRKNISLSPRLAQIVGAPAPSKLRLDDLRALIRAITEVN